MKSTFAQVEHHALVAGEQAIHGLTHPRRGGGVHLALHAHDSDMAEILDRHFEWMWANPGGQGEFLGANIHPERLDRD